MRWSTRMLAIGVLGAIASDSSVSATQGPPHLAQLRPAAPSRKSAFSAQQPGTQRVARWVGQDGHDFVGPNNRPEPSDVQDVHLILGGLDPAQRWCLSRHERRRQDAVAIQCEVVLVEGRA